MIFHILSRAEWEAAKTNGVYRGDTLASQGFIHCSKLDQVSKVANARFRDRKDLVLLKVDPDRLKPELKYEEGEPGELFPHLYGPLNLDAVVECIHFPPRSDGTFELPSESGDGSLCLTSPCCGALSGILLSLVVVAGLWMLLQKVDLGDFGKGDYLQYWAGGSLFLSGGNPYDLGQMARVEAPHNSAPITILVWNPPLIFLFVAPLALLPFDSSAMLWLVLMCAAFAGALFLSLSCAALQTHTRGSMLQRILFIATFYPMALSLYGGQSSPLLLLGFAGFTAAFLREPVTNREQFFGGFALALTALKPHLFYLVYLWLFIRCCQLRRLQAFGGFLCGLALLSAAVFVLRSDIFGLYSAAISTPPIYWKTPTLGSWLQEWSDVQETWMRLLPTAAIGLLAAALFLARPKDFQSKNLLLLMAPLSLITSPYGWHFDHVLLLPVALWCIAEAERKASWLAVFLIAANVAVLLTPRGLPMHFLIWYPAIFFVVALLLARSAEAEAKAKAATYS